MSRPQPRRQHGICASAVVGASIGIGATIARAGVVVNDTWLDGTRTDPASPTYSENGVDSDTDLNLESAWFQSGVGSLNPVGLGGPLRGNMTAGGTTSAAWTTYFTPEGSEVNLANNGDKLRVTWVFTPSNVNANNTSQNFRFALVDTVAGSGSARATTDGTLPNAIYQGYAIFGNMGQTLGNSNPFQLRERTLATSGALLNNSGDFSTQLQNGATTPNHGYDSGTQYTMVWEMTRNGSSLDISVNMSGGTLDNDGSAVITFNDATPNSFTYDTFGIRPSGATTTAELFDTSLFKVETFLVPEPAAMTLLVLGALPMIRRCRRA
jgi:hypothetical protein